MNKQQILERLHREFVPDCRMSYCSACFDEGECNNCLLCLEDFPPSVAETEAWLLSRRRREIVVAGVGQ